MPRRITAVTSVFPIPRAADMGLIELLARRYEKAPKKLLQFDPLLQALCHKFCRLNILCFYAIGAVNSTSWGHFEHGNAAELLFPASVRMSTQEDSCAGVLEAFLHGRKTCTSLVPLVRVLDL
jgi:hypothetical protein